MTELHLDADEWSNILHCLMVERDRADGDYRRYLDALVLKVEAALLPTTYGEELRKNPGGCGDFS